VMNSMLLSPKVTFILIKQVSRANRDLRSKPPQTVLNEKVIQSLLELRFLEIREANAYDLQIHIPWTRLQTEPVSVSLASISLTLVEPDVELELEPLPKVFQKKPEKKKKEKAAAVQPAKKA
jgi:hypothetical protein